MAPIKAMTLGLVLLLGLPVAPGCSKARRDSIALMNQGVKAMDRNDYKTAKSYFQRAVEVLPENAQAQYHLGLVELYDEATPGGAARAIDHLEKAREYESGDRDIVFQLARAKQMTGDLEGAIASFDEALELDPNFAPAHFYKGMALKAQKQWDAADARLREAIAIDPAYARAFIELAAMYEEFEHEDEARGVYEEALKHNRLQPDLMNGLGVLRVKNGQYEEAIELFRDVIARDGTRVDALFNLAFAYAEHGKPRKAIRYLDSFIQNAEPMDKDNLRVARLLKTALMQEL